MHIITYIKGDVEFEWDINKELKNIVKHGYTFKKAVEIFADPNIVYLEDTEHSLEESRHYAIGKTEEGVVLTVRYTLKGNVFRIFGAGAWRKWRKFYERKNT